MPDNFDEVWSSCQAMSVDLVIVPTNGRRKKMLLADMDSTMIKQECIDELADEAGVGARVKDITARAMNGELDFDGALRERVGLLKGLPETVIAKVLVERITLMGGGKTLLATMKAQGAYAALVSGGFTAFTSQVAGELGFDENRANTLLVADGMLTGEVGMPILGKQAKVDALKKVIDSPPAIPPRAMIPCDVDSPGDEAIRIAGQFDRKGEKVSRGYLKVMSDEGAKIAEGQSGRRELGRWLTDVETGAGRLTARVTANRVWHHLIGRGLVRTVDNFGRTGEMPSHPELLDRLAGELVESGWSMKALVRKIVLSRTFALSSEHDEASHAIDPDNKLIWRAHRRRLDPESIRDAMLVAANQLNLEWTDSTVSYLGDQATAVGQNKNRRRTDFPCRSVYLPVIRNDLPELFEVFDFADPHAATGARPKTTAATQGLFLLNDEMVMDAAEAMEQRLGAHSDDSEKIERLFEWTFSAPPADDERDEMLDYIRMTTNRLKTDGDPEPNKRAWAMACHAVLSTSRFQYLE